MPKAGQGGLLTCTKVVKYCFQLLGRPTAPIRQPSRMVGFTQRPVVDPCTSGRYLLQNKAIVTPTAYGAVLVLHYPFKPPGSWAA